MSVKAKFKPLDLNRPVRIKMDTRTAAKLMALLGNTMYDDDFCDLYMVLSNLVDHFETRYKVTNDAKIPQVEMV